MKKTMAPRTFMMVLFVAPLLATAQQEIIETPPSREMGASDETIVAPEPVHTDMPMQEGDPVFTIVEQMPEFPGGQPALMKYFSGNIKYPEEAREAGVQGRVFVRFVVEKEGTIRDIKVLRGVHPELDREALRVVKAMPNWNPGMQNGKVCCVQYNLPIVFKLED